MTMYRNLDRGDVLPASWTDALQEYIGTVAANLVLVVASTTQVQIVAGTGSDQVGVGIGGLWRYRSATISATVSGAAEVKDIFVTTTANSFSESPSPDTDNTVYAFSLVAIQTGTTPGGVAAFRKIGEVTWDGTKITRVRQTVGLGDSTRPISPKALNADIVPVDILGAASQSASLLNAGVTASADRFELSSAGQLRVPVVGSSAGLLLGGDAQLYRTSSSTLRTPGNIVVDGTTGLTGVATLTTNLVANTTRWGQWFVASDRSILALGTPSYSAATTNSRVILGLGGVTDSRGTVELEGDTGTIRFGVGGTTGPDTTLTRSGAATLTVTSNLVTVGTATFGGNVSLASGTDLTMNDPRYGKWRSGVDRSVIQLGVPSFGTAAGQERILLGLAGATDSDGTIELRGDTGTIGLGPGGTTDTDVALKRTAAERLDITAAHVGVAGTDRGVVQVGVPLFSTTTGTRRVIVGLGGVSDTQPTIALLGDLGQIAFGPGVTSATDITLTRTSASLMTLSSSLTINNALTVTTSLTHSGSNLAFYGGALHSQLAAPTQVRINAAPSALVTGSTLADVIAWVSRLANAMQSNQGTNLIGSGGVWSN